MKQYISLDQIEQFRQDILNDIAKCQASLLDDDMGDEETLKLMAHVIGYYEGAKEYNLSFQFHSSSACGKMDCNPTKYYKDDSYIDDEFDKDDTFGKDDEFVHYNFPGSDDELLFTSDDDNWPIMDVDIDDMYDLSYIKNDILVSRGYSKIFKNKFINSEILFL